MEQVGYDPLRIHSTVHTKANNHMLGNHPSNAVTVNDAVSDFKIYTMDWHVDRLEMFVGDEANPFQTRIFVWNKHGDWTTWCAGSICFSDLYTLVRSILSQYCLGPSINHSLFFSTSPLVVHGKDRRTRPIFRSHNSCYDTLSFRGGSQGIDENIFPRRMEVDWVHYYQWR